MVIKCIIKVLFFFIFLYSCTSNNDSREKIIQNGIEVGKVIRKGDINYIVQYRNADEILKSEGINKDNSNFDSRIQELENVLWFKINIHPANTNESILRYNLSSYEEYNSRLDYYLNHAHNDIKLEHEGRQLNLISYWFENNYNLSKYDTILIGFDFPKGEKINDDLVLSFQDRIFNNGIVKYKLKKESIRTKID